MNALTLFAVYQFSQEAGLKGLLLSFLIAICVLAVVACLIWAIERWIAPIPAPGKTVIAVILVILVLFWAISVFL